MKNICCPDNAVAPPINLMERITDYDALKNHQNLKLVNNEKCGQALADKISNGFDGIKTFDFFSSSVFLLRLIASVNEIPWIALLGYKLLDEITVWNCGGALITTRYVITGNAA